MLSCHRRLFTPFQVCPHFLWFHRLKPIHYDHIKGVNGIACAAPPVSHLLASPSICFQLAVLLFIRNGLITLALVICVRCLRRPTRVEHVPPLLQDIHHCNREVTHHCASINGIEEHSGRPDGQIGRDVDCRAREFGERHHELVKGVACIPCKVSSAPACGKPHHVRQPCTSALPLCAH